MAGYRFVACADNVFFFVVFLQCSNSVHFIMSNGQYYIQSFVLISVSYIMLIALLSQASNGPLKKPWGAAVAVPIKSQFLIITKVNSR